MNLDADTIALLEAGSAHILGMVDPDGRPHACRGWGLDVLPGQPGEGGEDTPARVRLLVDAHQVRAIADLAAGRPVAVNATDVPTLSSVQLKGVSLGVEPAAPGDADRMARFTDAFFRDIHETEGTSWDLLRRLAPDATVAVVIEVAVVYDQTPGPGAGRPLASSEQGMAALAAAAATTAGIDPSTVLDQATIDESEAEAHEYRPGLSELRRCFRGAVPAVIATAGADGIPNVTYLSSVHLVDEQRVALSNQFFSKTSRNLAENPRAGVLVIDPLTYDEFALDLVFERTERRGPLFESLRGELDAVAALSGMQDVFRLRAADVYRVVSIERVLGAAARRGEPPPDVPPPLDAATANARLAQLAGRLGRAPDLDALVETTMAGLAELLGYPSSLLALRDEAGERLFVIASHGYERQGVGSEIVVGEGPIGFAAERAVPVRVGSLRHQTKYGSAVRRSFEAGGVEPEREIPVPSLPGGQSLVATPAMALGQLIGVLAVEDTNPVAFDELDQELLSVVATLVASAIETDRARERDADDGAGSAAPIGGRAAAADGQATVVRCFAEDGSVFVDGEYLIKGVAGRILASLLRGHRDDGRVEFTNRELRLDPTIGLPEYRDNLESRLILLKRRLDERDAPVRIEKTGRGRFRLQLAGPVRFEPVDGPTPA